MLGRALGYKGPLITACSFSYYYCCCYYYSLSFQGNGGSTLHALQQLNDIYGKSLGRLRVILIHAGISYFSFLNVKNDLLLLLLLLCLLLASHFTFSVWFYLFTPVWAAVTVSIFHFYTKSKTQNGNITKSPNKISVMHFHPYLWLYEFEVRAFKWKCLVWLFHCKLQ